MDTTHRTWIDPITVFDCFVALSFGPKIPRRREGYVNYCSQITQQCGHKKELLVPFDLTRCQLDNGATFHGANFSPKGDEQDAYVLFPGWYFVLGSSSTHSLAHSCCPLTQSLRKPVVYTAVQSGDGWALERRCFWTELVRGKKDMEETRSTDGSVRKRKGKEREGRKDGRREGGMNGLLLLMHAHVFLLSWCPFFLFLFACLFVSNIVRIVHCSIVSPSISSLHFIRHPSKSSFPPQAQHTSAALFFWFVLHSILLPGTVLPWTSIRV